MGMAHSVRVATNGKYDIVDVLEMEPVRRRMLVASILVESEDKPKPKPKPKSRSTRKGGR